MSSSRETSVWISSGSSGVMKVELSLSIVRWVISSQACSRSLIARIRSSRRSHRSKVSSSARAASSALAESESKRSKKLSSRGSMLNAIPSPSLPARHGGDDLVDHRRDRRGHRQRNEPGDEDVEGQAPANRAQALRRSDAHDRRGDE